MEEEDAMSVKSTTATTKTGGKSPKVSTVVLSPQTTSPTTDDDISFSGRSEEGNGMDDIDNSRNLVVDSSTMFRKGPVPIECLSHKEQVYFIF